MPGGPHSGSKIWEAPDREIAKPGENRGEPEESLFRSISKKRSAAGKSQGFVQVGK
jgi:hypothetical protein